MPDPEGTITAGGDNVAAPGSTPVAPDITPSFPDQAPNVGGQTPSSGVVPPRPTPSFFRQLLFSLGKGLIEGTKAGLQAPPGPQGPAIAARTAIEAPQKAREQLTTNQMNDLNVAMSQLKLHQLQMITHQMEDDQQNAVYNRGRDTLKEFIEKGKAEVLATGDQKSVQDEFARRQADAKQAGQGLLPLQILPSERGPDGEPQYSLVSVGKERLTDDMDETWGASDLGVSAEDFKAAGLVPFKFHAPTGMDAQKAMNLKTTQYLNWLTKSSNQLGQWQRSQATIKSREKEGAATRDVRMKIATLQSQTGRYKADLAAATQSGDKLKVSALGKLIQASNNMSKVQAPLMNKAWEAMTKEEREEVTTARNALNAAKAEYDAVSKKQSSAISDLKSAVGSTRVAKGTKITPAIAAQYLQKAGGDRAKAMQAAKDDGYE